MRSLSKSGLSVCPNEPFYVTNNDMWDVNRYDHVAFASKIFESYDGFKIIIGHTMQMIDMASKNNARIILLKRNDYLKSLASYIVLMSGSRIDDSSTFETWTSTGRNMIYKPTPFTDHMLDKFLYQNYLIDHVYNQHECYLTTVNYEDPIPGISVLENYFECDIDLQLKQNVPLSEYFVNHEEFKDDIEKRLKKLQGGVYI